MRVNDMTFNKLSDKGRELIERNNTYSDLDMLMHAQIDMLAADIRELYGILCEFINEREDEHD